MDRLTVSVIYQGDVAEIQWGDKEPVDGHIHGYVTVHKGGALTVPFRTDDDEPFVFVLDEKGGRVVHSEDQPPGPRDPVVWEAQLEQP